MPRVKNNNSIKELQSALEAKDRKIAQLLDIIEAQKRLDKQAIASGESELIKEIALRHRVEQALQESEHLFRNLLHAAPDAIVIVDEQGIIKMANEQAEKLFCFPHEALLGEPLEKLLPNEFVECHRAYREEYLSEPYCRFMGNGQELYAQQYNGESIAVEVALSPLKTEHGWLVTAAIRDIRQRKQVEKELETYRIKLEDLVEARTVELTAVNKQLEGFSYTVSHDLRTPLRGIDGFSNILLQDFSPHLPSEAQDLLQRIRKASQRMGNMIDEMLELARVNRVTLNKKMVNLTVMVEDIVENLKVTQPDRSVNIQIAKQMHAFADQTLLRIIMENLLENAWKFSSHSIPSDIRVDCRQEGKIRIFYVKDNGVGFDMRFAGKLFGVFQRLHNSEEFPGTGIGLATVKRIIERHGGSIWAESSQGQGAIFSFSLDQDLLQTDIGKSV